MNEFTYRRARDVAGAIDLAAKTSGKFLAGGTNLIDLMREGIERPDQLVDVSRLAQRAR